MAAAAGRALRRDKRRGVTAGRKDMAPHITHYFGRQYLVHCFYPLRWQLRGPEAAPEKVPLPSGRHYPDVRERCAPGPHLLTPMDLPSAQCPPADTS